jgi:hypothetical protein
LSASSPRTPLTLERRDITYASPLVLDDGTLVDLNKPGIFDEPEKARTAVNLVTGHANGMPTAPG